MVTGWHIPTLERCIRTLKCAGTLPLNRRWTLGRVGTPNRRKERAGRWPRLTGIGRGGSTSVEFAVALPILLLMVMGSVQFGIMFHLKNEMTDAARDAVRALAVGEITGIEAHQLALDRLSGWNMTFSVVVTEPDPNDPSDRAVTVDVNVPMSQAVFMDFLSLFETGNLQGRVTMRNEV